MRIMGAFHPGFQVSALVGSKCISLVLKYMCFTVFECVIFTNDALNHS